MTMRNNILNVVIPLSCLFINYVLQLSCMALHIPLFVFMLKYAVMLCMLSSVQFVQSSFIYVAVAICFSAFRYVILLFWHVAFIRVIIWTIVPFVRR